MGPEHLADAVVEGRVLVVAAHPDDEIIGAAGLLCRARDPWVVHVTDGVPRDARLRWGPHGADADAYRAERSAELHAALDLARVPRTARLRLGLVDQEVALALVEATAALHEVFERVAPAWIVTHPYEGGHPDHDATAFACHAALAACRPDACLVEMTSYHARDGRLVTGEFLDDRCPIVTIEHDASLRDRKRAMLDCHASQREVLAPFGVDRERFRVAPRYRFDAPPHPGLLHYESQGWPMTGARFSSLARRASAARSPGSSG